METKIEKLYVEIRQIINLDVRNKRINVEITKRITLKILINSTSIKKLLRNIKIKTIKQNSVIKIKILKKNKLIEIITLIKIT
jgi:hypothetical protein